MTTSVLAFSPSRLLSGAAPHLDALTKRHFAVLTKRPFQLLAPTTESGPRRGPFLVVRWRGQIPPEAPEREMGDMSAGGGAPDPPVGRRRGHSSRWSLRNRSASAARLSTPGTERCSRS